MEENFSEQRWEPTTNWTHICLQRLDLQLVKLVGCECSHHCTTLAFPKEDQSTMGDKWVETLRPKLDFFTFYWLQKEEIATCNVVPMFELPTENIKHPNLEWRGQRRGADSFVPWSYPIWVQCLDLFVADCRCDSSFISPHKGALDKIADKRQRFWLC